MYHTWNGGGYAAFGFPWGGLIMGLLFIALVVFVAVLAIRAGRTERLDRDDPKRRALEILTERFVRGEIDADTFRSIKSEIEIKI